MTRRGILWLSHFVPYPPKGGAYQRSFHLIRALAEGFDVDLIAVRHKTHTHPPEELARAEEELGRFCRSVRIHDMTARTAGAGLYSRSLASLWSRAPATVELFRSADLRTVIRQAVASSNPAAVHVDTVSLAPYLEDLGGRACVLNHHNIESFMMRRRVAREPNPLKKAFFALEGRKLERFERSWAPRFATNLVVSAPDRDLMGKLVPGSRIDVVENGVDTEYFRPERREASAPRLIFAGRLDQYANMDAMRFFCSTIWPELRRRHPTLTMEIVGNHPPPDLTELANTDERLQVAGYVEDLRPRFQEAWAVVCPMREGAGTRLKVLDAMAMAMPMVATPMACEGIELTPGADVLHAETPDEFVVQVDRLLTDAGLRRALSASARRTVERCYAWSLIGSKLRAVYERCLE